MARFKFRLSRPISILLCSIAGVGLVYFLPRSPETVDDHAAMKGKIIHLGIETSNIRIALVEPDNRFRPDPAIIEVTTPDKTFPLHSLEQLKGLVHIGDAKQALHFVRFRTSRDYCYNWQGENTPQEIVSISQCSKPEFADTGRGFSIAPDMKSGRYGVLSDKAYTSGKFTPPKVTTVPSGYKIVRWICIYDGLQGTAVQQWQEFVATDGGYQCRVLKSSPPPKLPDTQWYIIGLR